MADAFRHPDSIMQRADVVIKHSGAVQIANRITLLQRRAWNVMLAYAYDQLLEADSHTMTVASLTERLGISSKNVSHLKSVLRGLADTRVEWNVLGKDGSTKWGRAALLADVEISDGTLEYSYGAILRRRLFNPSIYARIKLSVQNKFGSKHALALYELLVDYMGVEQTGWINVEEFRMLMGLSEGEYEGFRELNKFVIKKALDEINKRSDIEGSVEYCREGRRVIALKFWIKLKPEKAQRPALPGRREVAMGSTPDAFERYFALLSDQDQVALRRQAELIVEEQPDLFGYAREGQVWYHMRRIWKETKGEAQPVDQAVEGT